MLGTDPTAKSVLVVSPDYKDQHDAVLFAIIVIKETFI